MTSNSVHKGVLSIRNVAVLALFGASHMTVTATRPAIDPCATLCAMRNAANCSRVQAMNGVCERLFWDSEKMLRVGDVSEPGWKPITSSEAVELTTIRGETCQDVCDRTSGCAISFCKDNGHCQALFWEGTDGFCHHSTHSACRQDKPLLCRRVGDELPSTPTPVNTTSTSTSPPNTSDATVSSMPAIAANSTVTSFASADSTMEHSTQASNSQEQQISFTVQASDPLRATDISKEPGQPIEAQAESTTTKAANILHSGVVGLLLVLVANL